MQGSPTGRTRPASEVSGALSATEGAPMPSISATRSDSSVSRTRMVAAFVVPRISTTRSPTNPRGAALKTAHQFTDARYGGAALRRRTRRCVSPRAARDVAFGDVRSRRAPDGLQCVPGRRIRRCAAARYRWRKCDDQRAVHHHGAVSGAGSMAEEADHPAADLHATVGERLGAHDADWMPHRSNATPVGRHCPVPRLKALYRLVTIGGRR